jgi:hypothetical protein
LAAEVRNRIEAARPNGAWEKAGNLYGTVKSIRASTDISAPGRQGWILTLTNPKGAPGAFADQMQALASPKAAAIVQRDILDRSNLPLYKRANLFIAPFDGHGSAAGEELFRGHSLGGWDKGNFLNASDRAYAAYLNRVRVDSMDNFIKWVGKDANDPSLKLLGNYVNVSAGRGTILDVASAARLLNNAFFSPRYVASRLEYLIGMPMWDPRFGWKGTGKARLIIAKEYAKFVGAMGSVLALAKASGAEVNTDPTSTDYLKIKIGDTRIDMLAGLQQFMVIGSRLGLGKVTDSKGNSYKIEDAKYGQAQTGELLQRFFRSKSHPVIGTAWSLRDGKDYVGQPYDAKQAAQDLILPMSPQQLIEGLRKDGWDKDDAIGLLSFLGFGVQTFKKDETAKSRP